MSLREYLFQVFIDRSLRGWRDVRPTWREAAAVIAFVVLVGYAGWIVYWSGIENHCFWDKFGAKCQNGG